MRSERESIKKLLLEADPGFWPELDSLTETAVDFEDIFFLASLAKKAKARGMNRPATGGSPLRIAVLGGCSLYPLHELLSHLLEACGNPCELFIGEYDNYVSEIMDSGGSLYRFQPEVVFLLPGPQRCKYPGPLTDSRETVRAAAEEAARHLIELCRTVNQRTRAEVVLANFMLPGRRDPGASRSRMLVSDWSFRKLVNATLGLEAPDCVRICDVEFLASRIGNLAGEDARGWFESKQPCSTTLMVDICREAAHVIRGLRLAPKKVLVLDLDNTLWGGVVAEEGPEGIELGDTSPRGEAFKAFQKHLLMLKNRGVLLAVCSKNDRARALEAFEKHPDMVLRHEDFVAFYADWEPKSDNLKRMARELNLGLDSFVFVDDNPAEIEIVRQFAPEVETILLPADPSLYVGCLQDCQYFDPHRITEEDAQRTGQYRAEIQRKAVFSSAADMDSYLGSLEMEATLNEFSPADIPRLAQLINKSNQFNLTTRRRTEAEVAALVGDPTYVTLSLRLRDRFGDQGLVSVLIGRVSGKSMEIDTWIMSCRVLKRQVEEFTLNEVAHLALSKKCERLEGLYLPTAKNAMVRDFYPRMGFTERCATLERGEYFLDLAAYRDKSTKIRALRPS